ncbi:MAG: STAS domain-containing protein [Myxococcales bacterium]|nr:STAS domain-containing protein [Myxococcales bacterium]
MAVLEEILADAAGGNFHEVEVGPDDELAAVELGVNTVLADLRRQIAETGALNRELDLKIAERTRELQAKLEQITNQHDLIQRQRDAILELSTPVMQLWTDIIAMPVIGIIDGTRADAIMERLLTAISNRRARHAILDLTGVESLDTASAAHFARIIAAAGLIGARCVLTGIQSSAALALTDLGVEFENIETHRDLQSGLRACLLEGRGAS